MISYSGPDPDYKEEEILRQNITTLLDLRDLCLNMRHSRLYARSESDGYEANKLLIEICYLEKSLDYLIRH
jgi:hypothetical protein